MFIDLEKAYDRDSREMVWEAPGKKEVEMQLKMCKGIILR